MTDGAHPDLGELGPELRKLAQAILDRLDPAVRAAALLAASADSPGKCQQVWCPVCALAALVSGEEHPLLTIVAEHSVALYEVIRAVVGEAADAGGAPRPPDSGPPGGGGEGERPAARPSYQHIPVRVEDDKHES
ncbi:hypothetical protein [Mycolicibacter arupensis]|uniref:hypothetical protein n=1 Tax=Mycolicibacter arupensis TaxID=342002 RepID=UPI00122D166A|nr:hypothetical protein [Mycolicibacter arupensis]KAA1432043.1 hypothetical protein F0402_05610 [Mycolicibacter arupensis]